MELRQNIVMRRDNSLVRMRFMSQVQIFIDTVEKIYAKLFGFEMVKFFLLLAFVFASFGSFEGFCLGF